MSETCLTNREIMRKVREWQGAGYVHPLTCGKDSSHPVLEPGLRDEKVVLFCPGCDYVQKHIPGAVLRGVPSLPAKWLKITKPENEITVTIYRSAWQALLRGERVAALRVFSKNDLLNHQFGDKPEEFIIRVKITPIVS